jgi:hypothetical protein
MRWRSTLTVPSATVPTTLPTVHIHAHRRRCLNPCLVVLESHVNNKQWCAKTCVLTVRVICTIVIVVSLWLIQAIVAAVGRIGVSASVRVDVVRVIVAVYVSTRKRCRGAEWICMFECWRSGMGIGHARRCPRRPRGWANGVVVTAAGSEEGRGGCRKMVWCEHLTVRTDRAQFPPRLSGSEPVRISADQNYNLAHTDYGPRSGPEASHCGYSRIRIDMYNSFTSRPYCNGNPFIQTHAFRTTKLISVVPCPHDSLHKLTRSLPMPPHRSAPQLMVAICSKIGLLYPVVSLTSKHEVKPRDGGPTRCYHVCH